MTIVVPLAPITKKNHQQIFMNKRTGRRIVVPSPQYRRYEEAFKTAVKALASPFREPVNVRMIFYMPTRRRVDLVNLEESCLDCLVRAGILEDDNYKVVFSMDGSRVEYDKENPRTEIEIEVLKW